MRDRLFDVYVVDRGLNEDAKSVFVTLLDLTGARRGVLAFLLSTFIFLFNATACFAAPSIPFTVAFSEPVIVTGTPRLNLTVGVTSRTADYTGGSGTSSLTFAYQTQPGDLDLDGITLSNSLDFTNGSITDLSGNALASLIFTIPNTTGIKVDYPSLFLDCINNTYSFNGVSYGSLTGIAAALGGSFSRSTSATYFDSAGVMQSAAVDVPRFDYNPTTLAARGLLLEEARTNALRNGNVTGSIAGTPGTLPTNWGIGGGGLGALSQQVVGTGTEKGVPYVDFRIFGTASVSSFFLYFENATAIVAAQAQIWTSSFYAKLAAGTLANVSLQHIIYERNVSGTALVSGSTIMTLTGTLTRYVATRTLTNASTARLVSAIQFNTNVGQPIDVTVRFGGIQLERGAFVTSYIPTSGSAASRAADSLVISSTGWVGAGPETLFAQADAVLPQSAWAPLLAHNQNYSGNRYLLLSSTGNVTAGYSGVNVATVGAATSNTAFKAGGSFTASNTYAALNGVVASGAALSNGTDVTAGIGVAGSASLNGHLMVLKYYPLGVSSAQLQLLTQ